LRRTTRVSGRNGLSSMRHEPVIYVPVIYEPILNALFRNV